MSKHNLIIKSLLSAVARFIGVALNFVLRILITRSMSVAEAGVLFLLMTLSTGFSLLSRLGLEQLLIKKVAATKDDEQAYQAAFLRKSYVFLLLSSIIFIAIWLLISPWARQALFHQEIALSKLLWASITLLAFNIIIINSFYLKAIHRTITALLLPNALPAFSFLLLLAIFWGNHQQNQLIITLYIASLVLASLLSIGLVSQYLFNKQRSTTQTNIPSLKNLLQNALPLAPISIFSFAMLWSDTLLVGYLMDTYHLALFNIAANLSFISLFFLSALEATIYPRLINISQHNPEKLTKFFWQATSLVIASLLVITLVMSLLAEHMLWVFKPEYVQAQSSLIILLFAQFLRACSLTFSFMFIIREHVKYLNIVLVAALMINLIANSLLIPEHGMQGAAIATLIANGFLASSIILLFSFKRLLRHA